MYMMCMYMDASARPCISSVLKEAEASQITTLLRNETKENNSDGKLLRLLLTWSQTCQI